MHVYRYIYPHNQVFIIAVLVHHLQLFNWGRFIKKDALIIWIVVFEVDDVIRFMKAESLMLVNFINRCLYFAGQSQTIYFSSCLAFFILIFLFRDFQVFLFSPGYADPYLVSRKLHIRTQIQIIEFILKGIHLKKDTKDSFFFSIIISTVVAIVFLCFIFEIYKTEEKFVKNQMR